MYRLIYAFDHLAIGAVNCPQAYVSPYGLGLLSVTAGRIDLINKGRNYFGNYFSAGVPGARRATLVNLASLGIVFEKRVIIGYNWQCGVYSSELGLLGPGAYYSPFSGYTVSLTWSDIGTPYPGGYIEIVLDFDAKTTEVFVNGVRKYTKQNTEAEQQAIATNTKAIIFPNAINGSDYVGTTFTDIYVRDSVGEVEQIKPLGTPRFTPITVDSVTADGFSPVSAATLDAALNAKPAPLAVQPTIQAADNSENSTVTALLKVTPVAGRVPGAFCLYTHSMGPKPNAAVVNFTLGGVPVSVTNGEKLPPSSVTIYGSFIGVVNKQPDQRTWSWANINQSTLSIKYT